MKTEMIVVLLAMLIFIGVFWKVEDSYNQYQHCMMTGQQMHMMANYNYKTSICKLYP